MNAAHKLLSKSVLIFAVAFLVASTALAQTPPNLQVNPNTVTLPVPGGVNQANVNVTSSGTDQITFTAAPAPGDNFYNFTVNGASVGSGGSVQATTPATVTIFLTTGLTQQRTGTITLTNNTTGSTETKTITVNYVPAPTGGTGSISANPSVLTPNVPSGQNITQQVTLSTTSASPVGFTVSTGGSPSFVTVSTVNNQLSVSGSSPATLNVTSNAGGLANGVYNNTITVAPNGGSPTVISVQMTVGAGGTTGTYFANPSSLFFTYPSGTLQQNVQVSSGTSSTFNATPSSSNSWLSVNGSTGTTFSNPVGSNLTVSVNGNASTLSSGTYFGTITLANPFNSADTTTISVQLSVSGGSLSNLNVSPSSLTFNVLSSNSGLQQQNVQLSTFNGAGTNITGLQSVNGGTWLSASQTSFSLPATIQIFANPAGLVAGTYTGAVNVSLSGGVNGTQSIPVTLVVGGTGTVTGAVAPASLNFAYQLNAANQFVSQQMLTVLGTGTITVSVNVPGNVQWLNATGSGQAPGTVTVLVNSNASTLPAGTYNATITVTTGSGVSTIPVTLTVSGSAVLQAFPGTLNFNYQPGDNVFVTQMTVNTSDNSSPAISVTPTVSWITITGQTSATAPASWNVTVNPAGLPNGLNTGAITITSTGTANSPLSIPVVVNVSNSTSAGQLTLNPTSLSFSGNVGGAVTAAKQLSVTAASATTFTLNTTGGSWLSVSPATGSNLTTPQTINITANPANLTAGTYTGSVLLTTAGVTQTVPVTFVVSAAVGGNVTVSPTAMTFTSQNGAAPAVQGLVITSANSSQTQVNSVITTSTSSGGSWLSAGVASGTTVVTPITLAVSANPTGLASGTYNGTITVSPTGGTPVTVNVTLTVSLNVVSASTASGTSLSFSYRVGDAAPATQPITVAGSGSFTATAQSTGNWLTVNPTTGTAPGTVNAGINTSGLQAGTYNGTIVVAGTGSTTGSTTITVSLTVTAPLPTITRVTNAASYAAGTISPGEIVTVFGTNLGPTPAAGLAVDSSGRQVTTQIGNVQVLFNGIPGPMVFAGATQASVQVPYELKGQLSATVQLRYNGQTSNSLTVAVASSAPGVFTADASGSGPAAILYPNPTFASATRGDVIVIYATGEGETNPAGVTGSVTQVRSTPPITPAPLLQVVVLIDGQPAEILFAGEAPGFISGALQLNVRIPANARSGNLPLAVTIGGISSQAGVTVAVR